MPTARPSSDLGPYQQIALCLAGAVALPAPYPAAGTIYLCTCPKGRERAEGEQAPRDKPATATDDMPYFVKIVEEVDEKHVVSRTAGLKELLAVRLKPQGQRDDGGLCTWDLVVGEDLANAIAAAKQAIAQMPQDIPNEVELFSRKGVVYLLEAAPVLLRLEFGVTAAQSIQSTRGKLSFCPNCC